MRIFCAPYRDSLKKQGFKCNMVLSCVESSLHQHLNCRIAFKHFSGGGINGIETKDGQVLLFIDYNAM
jgi:hypothetical protein